MHISRWFKIHRIFRPPSLDGQKCRNRGARWKPQYFIVYVGVFRAPRKSVIARRKHGWAAPSPYQLDPIGGRISPTRDGEIGSRGRSRIMSGRRYRNQPLKSPAIRDG